MQNLVYSLIKIGFLMTSAPTHKLAKLGIFVIALLATGCATIKVPQATGGSRSDGVVNLSYEYGAFEKPIVDWNAAKMEAQKRCRAWGYENTEPFGGVQTNCTSDYENCVVTVPYQCQNPTKSS